MSRYGLQLSDYSTFIDVAEPKCRVGKPAAGLGLVCVGCEDAGVVNLEEWDRVRSGLRFGQRFQGRVTKVPNPGATGIFVDIGLPVGGFVDVLLLPMASDRWPKEGTVAEFELWWADERPQVRLKPVDRHFLRDDFEEWLSKWRPGWPAEHGQVLAEDSMLAEAGVDATATPPRRADVVTGFTAETE
ncbi:hypothetical protein ACWCQQ_41815 [Streptomyces sp. NPDC002143]